MTEDRRPVNREALERWTRLCDEELLVALKALDLHVLIEALLLAQDAIEHINLTGETLQTDHEHPVARSWPGPERWGRDPEGVLDTDLTRMRRLVDRLKAIDDKHRKARAKAGREIMGD